MRWAPPLPAARPGGFFSPGLRRRLRAGGLLALLALATVAAIAAEPLRTLRWAARADVQSLDPHAQNESLSNQVNAQVYESLIQRGPRLELVPGLATAWEAESPTVWRVRLRTGVRFHEGEAFDAEDVRFSVERARAGSSDLKVYAHALGRVEVLDAQTLRFVLPQPNPVFLEHLSVLPIMSRAWCEAHGATRPLNLKAREEGHATRHANGTGPYRLVRREADVATVFVRHAGWWGQPRGNVERVEFRPIAHDATRLAALMSGEIDFILDVAAQDVARLRRQPRIKLVEGLEHRVLFIGLDQHRDRLLHGSPAAGNPFKDRRVRQALQLAIDLPLIQRKLMRGLAEPAGAVMPAPAGLAGALELDRPVAQDLEAARRLLAEAGHAEGFGFTLDCPNNRYLNDAPLCLAIASMWAKIGLQVRVQAMPRSLYFPKLQRGDTSAYLLGWGGAITDAQTTLTPLYHSPSPDGAGAWNFGGVRHPAVDAAVRAAAREADPARRAAFIRTAVQTFRDEVLAIPLHRQHLVWAMRPHVQVVQRPDHWLEWSWVRLDGG